MTLNLEENVSCKNLIWFDTKLLRWQRLVSDARRNVRLYTTIKDRKSPLKGSRPSVPTGLIFWFSFYLVNCKKISKLWYRHYVMHKMYILQNCGLCRCEAWRREAVCQEAQKLHEWRVSFSVGSDEVVRFLVSWWRGWSHKLTPSVRTRHYSRHKLCCRVSSVFVLLLTRFACLNI